MRSVKYVEKYGSYKNVTVSSYQGGQDIPFKMVRTSYKKSGKKFKKTSRETSTNVVAPLN